MKTYQLELAVVASVLATVTIVSGGRFVDWLAMCAVIASFGHAQIADRLQEQEAARPITAVECHWKLRWYFVAKEALWLAVFVSQRSWAALAGVGLFLAYGLWRRWWRGKRPLGRL